METTRIPRLTGDFNAYLNDTTNYLQVQIGEEPNWHRLGITSTEMDTWASFRSQWNLLYPKYTQKKETRTTSVKDQLLLIQKRFNRCKIKL